MGLFNKFKSSLDDATKKAKTLIDNKPKIVGQYHELVVLFDGKKIQLGQLEATKEAISPEMFDSTKERYLKEIDDLTSKINDLLKEIIPLKQEQEQIKLDASMGLPPLQKELKDIIAMQKAGAMDNKDFGAKKKELTGSIQSYEKEIAKADKMLGFLNEIKPVGKES